MSDLPKLPQAPSLVGTRTEWVEYAGKLEQHIDHIIVELVSAWSGKEVAVVAGIALVIGIFIGRAI